MNDEQKDRFWHVTPMGDLISGDNFRFEVEAGSMISPIATFPECPTCNGTGRVEETRQQYSVMYESGRFPFNYKASVICPACKGNIP